MGCHIGIDPGGSGGIAFMNDKTGDMIAHPMPETERDIWDLFEKLGRMPGCRAVIEKVGVMPGQGISSGFKFGMGYGGLRMALTAARIPFVDVTPRKWQEAMGIPVRGEKTKVEHKNLLKAKAQQMHPELKITLATADAILLAEYLRKQ